MKKLSIVLLLVFGLALMTSAQEVWLGLGRVLVSSNGNAIAYETGFETNYNLGIRYKFDNNFAASITFTKDTSKIGKWLDRHNFIKATPVKYEYVKISPRVEYHFKHFYALFGAPIFTSPDKDIDTKIGLEAGFGSQYYFSEHFGIQAETKFCHLKDFLVPVANTLFCDVALIWKW